MPTRDDPWPDGTPCWVDCQVDDTAKAAEFYSALFGWDIGEPSAEFGYLMALKDGRPAAGIAPKPEGVSMPGMWSTYVATSDADAAIERAKAAGGTFGFDAFDVGDFGRMTFGEDPTGASYGIWQAKQHVGVGIFNEPNTLSWNELHTRDFESAKEFYSAVFGWEYGDISNPDMSYAIIRRAGEEAGIGGVFRDTMMPPTSPAHWLVWFAAANCDESTAAASGLGSKVFLPPTDSPFGRMSVVQAPQGEVFGLIDLDTEVGEQPTPT